jgi:hypothetical protein
MVDSRPEAKEVFKTIINTPMDCVLITGERGSYEFLKMLENIDFSLTPTSEIRRKEGEGKSQILNWNFMGKKITLITDPVFDSRITNKLVDPRGGVKESYKFEVYTK